LKTCHCPGDPGWEGFKNRDKSEDLPDTYQFQGFREVRLRVITDSIPLFLKILNKVREKKGIA